MDGCGLKKICFIYRYYHTYLHKFRFVGAEYTIPLTERPSQMRKRQDTIATMIPCLCFLRMALTYIVPVLYRPTEAVQTVLRQAELSW